MALLITALLVTCTHEIKYPLLNRDQLANQYYQDDAKWYLDNIPFFECSDKRIEEVYYYRWKLYKAHIRNIGENRYVITEFINHVPWDREPYCTINAASMHHIYEGRWLKDNRYMDGYIDYLYHGGNDRRYSESISDAAYARYLVNADSNFIITQVDSMKNVYDRWYDHFDTARNLYYIAAMPDATEYTVASIDASGGKDGFDDGEAFRPTINSYMYGNAMAIANISKMKRDAVGAQLYLKRAAELKKNVEQDLWNDSLQHFADRFKVHNQYVQYWNFIRSRELAGLIPWYFSLPSDTSSYNGAWKHAVDTSQLLGKFGFRTNEPSYQYYFKQFVFFEGQRGSQWNGPSWPYQTSQVITGLANFLNNYNQQEVSNSDYVKMLRLFALQHYLPNGKLDLVENYDPNLGGPIVYYYWSNHYLHSSFNNLVITGLCGIRPSSDDSLVINPLVDKSIQYFCLEDVFYHGHKLTVIYDVNGGKYHLGKGLTVFVDGKKSTLLRDKHGRYKVAVGAAVVLKTAAQNDFALNVARKGYPKPSASVNSVPDTSLYQAMDGKIWYFPEITNRWTTLGSTTKHNWFAVDFGQSHTISGVRIALFADNKTFGLPDSITVDYKKGDQWFPVTPKESGKMKLVANTQNTVGFDAVNATAIRVNFTCLTRAVAVSEIECY